MIPEERKEYDKLYRERNKERRRQINSRLAQDYRSDGYYYKDIMRNKLANERWVKS